MDYFFYLIMVKKASADETESEHTSGVAANVSGPGGGGAGGITTPPKFYLKPVTIIQLDTFVATHGTFTDVDILDPSERIMGKRKLHGDGNLHSWESAKCTK